MPLDPQEFAEIVTTAIKAATAPMVARIVALEARAAVPGRDGRDGSPGVAGEKGMDGKPGLDGAPGRDGRDGTAGAIGEKGMDGLHGKDGLPGLDGRDGRDGLAGPVGEKGLDGLHGKDGLAGADGRDGTLENLKVLYDGERTLTLCFKNGDPIDGGIVVLPIPLDRGVYRPDAVYEKGDAVTYGGSVFIAQMATTARPEDGSRAWRLAVKHGREGKPGLNGKDGINGRDLTADVRRY